MIQICNWDRFQHYKKEPDRAPLWVKLYRDILTDYHFNKLDSVEKWTLIGLWVLAAETTNSIPDDANWIKQRLQLNKPPALTKLEKLGFIIILDSASREALESGSRETLCPEEQNRTEQKKQCVVFEKEFTSFWNTYPLKVGKKAALKAYQARRRAGVNHADIMAGLSRYLAWIEATDTKIKHPSTFVGPNEWWAEAWTVTEADRAKKDNGPPTPKPDAKFAEPFIPLVEDRKPHPKLTTNPKRLEIDPELIPEPGGAP